MSGSPCPRPSWGRAPSTPISAARPGRMTTTPTPSSGIPATEPAAAPRLGAGPPGTLRPGKKGGGGRICPPPAFHPLPGPPLFPPFAARADPPRPSGTRHGARKISGPWASGALLVTCVFPPVPRLVWNASASAPIGLYRVSRGSRLTTGDMVIAWLPRRFRHFAATRRYLPGNVPLVKRIAGVPDDRICAVNRTVFVNGLSVATRLATDGEGRAMPWWTGCRTLHKGEYFLLMAAVPASFDGRYFGVSQGSDIIGKATLLWAR